MNDTRSENGGQVDVWECIEAYLITFLSKLIPNPKLAASAPHCPWRAMWAPALYVSGFTATVRQEKPSRAIEEAWNKGVILNGSILDRHCENIQFPPIKRERSYSNLRGSSSWSDQSEDVAYRRTALSFTKSSLPHATSRKTESRSGGPGDIKAYAVTWNMGWRSISMK